MIEGVIIAVLGILVGAVVAVWQLSQRRAVEADRDRLETTNQQHLANLDERQSEVSDLKSRIARHEADAANFAQRERDLIAQHEQAEQRARDTFKALAGDTLQGNSTEFLKQANEKLKPIGELLASYQNRLAEIEEKRDRAYGQLREQVGSLHESQKGLTSETARLVAALRRPEGRGRWGELQMERLFELAGMTERIDFDAQASVAAAGGGKLRPDYTVRLPNDRVIVIDSKAPMDAYLSAVEATDDTEREAHLNRHVEQVRDMARKLGGKEYWAQCDGSPEFVVMYISPETALHAAAQRDPDLIERAMAQQVIIATPTLLMALLKTVALGWREQAISENAKQIAQVGREMYDRLRVMLDHVVTTGSAIDRTNKAYNELVGSIERNVLPQARRFERLDATKSKPAPDDVPRIEVNPRVLDAPEAAAADD